MLIKYAMHISNISPVGNTVVVHLVTESIRGNNAVHGQPAG